MIDLNSISFTYNPFGYKAAYENVLKNLRIHYPSSDVFVYIDSSIDNQEYISDLAASYACHLINRQKEMKYIHKTGTFEENSVKMQEWIDRIIYTCISTDSTWVMLLEDDVLIRKKINRWPEADCGRNRHNMGFLGGGSIFRRVKFLEAVEYTNIYDFMERYHVCTWAGDVLLKHMFNQINATEEKWVELAEPGYWDDTDYSVLHKYKDLHILG
jgi:hypothetical protein